MVSEDISEKFMSEGVVYQDASSSVDAVCSLSGSVAEMSYFVCVSDACAV